MASASCAPGNSSAELKFLLQGNAAETLRCTIFRLTAKTHAPERDLVFWVRRAWHALRIDTGRLPNPVAASAAVISIFGVYVYFAGWVYTYFYYKDFGVSLTSFDIPVQYFFVHSYTVLASRSGIALVCALLVVAYLYAARKLRRLGLILTMVAAFPALFVTAKSVAHAESQETRTNPKLPVRLAFKDPAAATLSLAAVSRDSAAPPAPDIFALNASERLHLLLETKDRVVVFYQPAPIGGAQSVMYVFSITRSDLAWSMVVSK